MKKLLIVLIAIGIPVILSAQKTPFESLYDRYVSEPGFESTQVLPGSTSFEWEKSLDNPQVKEMMQSIESIRILKVKADSTRVSQEKVWKNMQKAATEEQYKEVVTVSAEKAQVRLFILEGTEGHTREVALIVKEDDEIVMMTMTGNMDFSAMFSHENMKQLREIGEYYMKDHKGCESNKE
jgi:hypothetical protein